MQELRKTLSHDVPVIHTDCSTILTILQANSNLEYGQGLEFGKSQRAVENKEK